MFDQLQPVFSGELYFDDKGLDAAIRTVYATDASEYQEKPLAVAIPKTIADIKALIAFANEQKISLIPRAAGTSSSSRVCVRVCRCFVLQNSHVTTEVSHPLF